MTLDTVFSVASPKTLASLIAEIRMLGTGAEPAALRLAVRAEQVLRANVGQDEAWRMIDDAGH